MKDHSFEDQDLQECQGGSSVLRCHKVYYQCGLGELLLLHPFCHCLFSFQALYRYHFLA